MTVSELERRIREAGLSANRKSLYRLKNQDQPLERLDLRMAGAICQVCHVPLSELIVFQFTQGKPRQFPASKQKRLNTLMVTNSQGKLTSAEREELRRLVRETEELALENARTLAGER
jgi:hypothetical protein